MHPLSSRSALNSPKINKLLVRSSSLRSREYNKVLLSREGKCSMGESRQRISYLKGAELKLACSAIPVLSGNVNIRWGQQSIVGEEKAFPFSRSEQRQTTSVTQCCHFDLWREFPADFEMQLSFRCTVIENSMLIITTLRVADFSVNYWLKGRKAKS